MLSSLRTFLSTIPEVYVIKSTSTLDETYNIIKQNKPDLIIVDVDLLDSDVNNPGYYRECHQMIIEVSEKTRCIVLVNNFDQQEFANNSGVDVALIKGELCEQLRGAIRAYAI